MKRATTSKKKENYLIFHDMNAVERVRMLFLFNILQQTHSRENCV